MLSNFDVVRVLAGTKVGVSRELEACRAGD
jgi:hypothetical protein